MNLFQNFLKFIRKLLGPKVTKTQKTTTIKLNKTPSSIKTQRVSPDVQIKQVERKQQQKTIPQFIEQIPDPVIEFFPAVIPVRVKRISELRPGYLYDTCSIMNVEDYPEILKYGREIKNKLYNRPMYFISLSKKEYAGKRCPKDYDEKVIDRGFTGKPRDLYHTLLELSKSLRVHIYLVEVENSLEIKQLEKKLLPEFHKFDLHPGDSTFLAFTILTNSTLITSDDRLILSSVQAQCPNPIEFNDFLEKLIQPSPITVVLRKRRNYYKHDPRWKKR